MAEDSKIESLKKGDTWQDNVRIFVIAAIIAVIIR